MAVEVWSEEERMAEDDLDTLKELLQVCDNHVELSGVVHGLDD